MAQTILFVSCRVPGRGVAGDLCFDLVFCMGLVGDQFFRAGAAGDLIVWPLLVLALPATLILTTCWPISASHPEAFFSGYHSTFGDLGPLFSRRSRNAWRRCSRRQAEVACSMNIPRWSDPDKQWYKCSVVSHRPKGPGFLAYMDMALHAIVICRMLKLALLRSPSHQARGERSKRYAPSQGSVDADVGANVDARQRHRSPHTPPQLACLYASCRKLMSLLVAM